MIKNISINVLTAWSKLPLTDGDTPDDDTNYAKRWIAKRYFQAAETIVRFKAAASCDDPTDVLKNWTELVAAADRTRELLADTADTADRTGNLKEAVERTLRLIQANLVDNRFNREGQLAAVIGKAQAGAASNLYHWFSELVKDL